MSLHIGNAGSAQPARRAVEAALRHLAGDELAPVSHAGGERQSLAACAGAEIDDPHPGPGVREQRGDLRAFVLHLDKALSECREVAERHPFAQTQSEGRQRGALRGHTLCSQRAARLFPVRPQQIDAQIGRGRPIEDRHLAFQPLPENPIEIRLEPIGEIIGHCPRHLRMAQGAGREIADEAFFDVTEPSRTKAVAVAACEDRVGPPSLD